MYSTGFYIKKALIYAALILLAIMCMLPFLLMIVNATEPALTL